jgi:hypothetical protein
MGIATTRGLWMAYYRSIRSYRIPFEPQGQIDYAETEGLRSYYIAYHDDDDRVVEFTKVLLTCVRRRHVEVPGFSSSNPVTFFAMDRESEGPELGQNIPYRDTEDMTEFFEGQFAGSEGDVAHFRKEQAMRDVYAYWPNGRLRKRVLMRMDKTISTWRYDEKGRVVRDGDPVESPLPSADRISRAYLVFSGEGADKAARELSEQINLEEIPGLLVKYPVAKTANAAHVDAANPTAVSSLIEALYSWITTSGRKQEVKLQIEGQEITTIRPDHFNRREYLARLSEALEVKS